MAALKKTSRRSMLSAGILAYRKGARGLEVLLVHPGGPFWRTKDNGAWSIPKGEIDAADAPEQVAQREFAETRPECFDWSTPGAGGDPTARREAR
ncbi:putative NUDIX family NTP pyrophosphohydrolase [Bradyrhizobium sp. F1.13.1]